MGAVSALFFGFVLAGGLCVLENSLKDMVCAFFWAAMICRPKKDGVEFCKNKIKRKIKLIFYL